MPIEFKNQDGTVTAINSMQLKNLDGTIIQTSKCFYKASDGVVSEVWSSGIPISSLPIGSKVKLVGQSQTIFTNKFTIIDKNHKNYPANSVTIKFDFLSKNKVATNIRYASGATNTNLKNHYNALSSNFKAKVLTTSITFNEYVSGSPQQGTLAANIFAFGVYEMFGVYGVYQQVDFSAFDSIISRIGRLDSGTAARYFLRDAQSASNIHFVETDGTRGAISQSSQLNSMGMMNVIGDLNVSEQPDSDGYYIIQS